MLNRLRALYSGMAAWSWLPTLCFAVLPALIVRNKFVAVASDATRLWGDYLIGDIRSWWKASLVIGIVGWMAFMPLMPAQRRIPYTRLSLLLGGALFGLMLSGLLSPFPYTKVIGYTGQYEGFFVLAAYLVAVGCVGRTARTEERLLIVRSSLVVAAVNIALGIMAGMRHDFWQSGWGAWVIGLPRALIRYNFSDSNMASGTVYQPNHYGMLTAMLGALSLGMIGAEKKPLWKYIWGAAYALSAAALLFSRSRAGTMVLAALTFAVLCFALFRFRMPKVNIRKTVIFTVVVVVLALFASFTRLGDAAALFLRRSTELSVALPLDSEITDVSLADSIITVKTRNGGLRLGKSSPADWYAAPEGGQRSVLSFAERGGWRVAQLPGAGTALRINERGNVLLQGPDTNLEFFTHGAEIFAVDETRTNLALRTEIPASSYIPNGYEGFLSARGYIWARSLEKWLERPFFGWGPGSLPLVFPNAELLNKKRYSGGLDEDKGHSILITFLVQTGIVGTILYCLPFGYALWILAKSRARLRPPLLLAMAAYLACGLTNDSTPGVTPLFCVFAGLAVAEAEDVLEIPCSGEGNHVRT